MRPEPGRIIPAALRGAVSSQGISSPDAGLRTIFGFMIIYWSLAKRTLALESGILSADYVDCADFLFDFFSFSVKICENLWME